MSRESRFEKKHRATKKIAKIRIHPRMRILEKNENPGVRLAKLKRDRPCDHSTESLHIVDLWVKRTMYPSRASVRMITGARSSFKKL